MVASFVHDIQSQRVVFAPGAVARVADEAARLGLCHALVIATPGSGARLGGRIVDILGGRAAGQHAQAALHVPKPVAEMGIAAARGADGLVAAGGGRAARAECLVAAWLAGVVLASGTALQHKLAHVLGGLGLPHAETHAIILPHVTRFNLAAAAQARTQLAAVLGGEGADRLAEMLRGFPIPQRLTEVGFDRAKTDFVAQEIAAMKILAPRKVLAEDVRMLLAAAA